MLKSFFAGAVREPLLRRDGGDGGGVVGQAGRAQAQDWQANQVRMSLIIFLSCTFATSGPSSPYFSLLQYFTLLMSISTDILRSVLYYMKAFESSISLTPMQVSTKLLTLSQQT